MTNEEILNLNAFSTPQPTDAKQPIQQVNKTVPFPSFSDTNGPSSFLGKVGADAKLLGQVSGIIGSNIVHRPLQTLAGVGVGAVGGFLLGGPVGAVAGGFAGGMVGATGVKQSVVGAGESLKDIVNPQYYQDHPLLAAVNTLTWAALPADAASLHIINPVIDGSVTAGVDAAIGAGVDVASAVPEQTLRAVIKKSLSDGSIGEVIKSGDSSAVKDAVIKGLNGIKALSKEQIATIADGVEQSVVGGVSKINPTVFKGIDLVAHPIKTFLSKPIGAIGKAVFGDLSPNSAMARVFGMKAVSSNPEFFAQAEDYMTRSAEAEGYGTGVDAVENYVRKVLIDDGSFLKNKSGVAEDFIHKMTQYANAEGVTNRMTQIGADVFEGKQIVPGKVLRPVDIEAITKTIEKMSPEDFTGLSTGQIANKVLKNFDITDFKQAELADLINKNGRTLNGIIESVKELTGPALVPEDILNSNPELLKLANQMKDTGYSPVYAPTKKPVTLLNEPGQEITSSFTQSLKDVPPPLDIQFKQTALGNLIDKIGLSARYVGDQLLQKLYQQQLSKLAVDTFGEGTIDLGSRVVPVDKLYDQLNVIRGIKGKTSVNMLTAGDLKSLGVAPETASKIIDVIKKSNMLPVNYAGIGPAITNFAKAYIPGYNSFLNATLWGHFGLGPEYGVIAAFKDNVLSIFGGGKINLPQENSMVTSSVASKLADWIRKVPGSDELFFPKNTNVDIANYRQYILGKTGPSDLQDAMDSGEMIDWTNANDLQKGTESYNLGQKLLGYSRQNTEIAFAKNMASKYGIELKDLGKYPGIADDIANTVRDQFHYRPGLETSPLMRTLNTIVYPIRFEAKVASRTMEWLAKQNPIIRGELITQITAGTNFLQSPEGKQYVKKNAGLLMALEYLTPYNEIGTTIEAATKGDLFGGNMGYIGGLPAGFVVNILQGLGLAPKATQKDEFTGKNYPLRSVPKKIVSGATVEVVLENLLQHMFPTSLYNITGGVIPSVITMVRPKIQSADKGALKKQFKKVPANYNILNRLGQ